MTTQIAVIGTGRLADRVGKLLSARNALVRMNDLSAGIPASADIALLLSDDWPAWDELELREILQEKGIPWLRAFAFQGEGVIGPLVRPGTPGCSQCAELRLRDIGADSDGSDSFGYGHSDDGGDGDGDGGGSSGVEGEGGVEGAGEGAGEACSSTGLRHVALMVATEAEKALSGHAHTMEHIYIVNLYTLGAALHVILPDPSCSVCGEGLPEDSAELAQIALQPAPKSASDRYRCRPLDELGPALIRDYLDERTGLLDRKTNDLLSPFAVVDMRLPSYMLGDEIVGGRSHSYEASTITAVLEGLERYCGQIARGKRTVVYDSYTNLQAASPVLDPRSAGLYADEQYRLPDFPYEPFDEDRELEWVWGYSLLQDQPILVPEQMIYYRAGYTYGFVQASSNGCALGGSLEEAILHGCLEIVERDAFLMSWYGRLPLRRLDPHSANDRELLLMIDKLETVLGYEVQLFNMTTEVGIPSIWVLARSREPNRFAFLCGAGAHFDPVRAAKGAIHELASMLPHFQIKYDLKRGELMNLYGNPDLVESIEHHSLVYGLPQAEERFAFLLNGGRPPRSFREEFQPGPARMDLREDLTDFMEKMKRLELDVIVVDQTCPEIRRNGLHCVKVLIPGMVPITFGHRIRRTTGLPRLLHVPVELGYAERPLTVEQLNPYPHPFY
ncbi:TOMM precursor leader peptide-binding protein [Paenibacillus chartarius]|uniref:TOMM leader peptide-binding protein n=1 Tax=Paenibacillus chartarius TaxID=747481 RepID=A0ABV6DFI4_9BACL